MGNSGYFDDEGNQLNPNLIRKPPLCIGCLKNNNPKEKRVCDLTRLDQKNEPEFICYAFESLKKE